MIELGNTGGKQAEKEHCKLEHVVEREIEREKRLQKSSSRTQAWDSATVQLSLGWVRCRLRRSRSTLCLFLFPLLVNKAAPPLAITESAKLLSSTHTHHEIPLQDSPVQNLLTAHWDLFNGGTQYSVWPGTRIACRLGTGGPGSGCPEPNITGTSPAFWNRAGTWVLEPGANRDHPPPPFSWLVFKFFGVGLQNFFRGVKYVLLGADIGFIGGFEIGFLSESLKWYFFRGFEIR